MKCTQCGNEKFISKQVNGVWRGERFDTSPEQVYQVCYCLNCGHREKFYVALVEEYKSSVEKIKELQERMIEINHVISDVKNKQDALVLEMKRLTEESKSLDITIRQKQEIERKIKEIHKEKVNTNCPSGIYKEREQIERELNNLYTKAQRYEEI